MSVLTNRLGAERDVLALAIARGADSLGFSFMIIVLPLYIESGAIHGTTAGLSVTLITGLVLSAFGFLNSAVQPFAGRLSDRLGRRKPLVLVGLVFLVATNFGYSLASTYLAVILLRIIQGIGVGITVAASVALVDELATDSNRGGNMGTYNTFRMAGIGGGPILAGAVIGAGTHTIAGRTITGVEAAFYVATLGALCSLVLVWLLVTDPTVDVDTRTGDTDTEGPLIAVRDPTSAHLLDPVFTLGLASLCAAVGVDLLSAVQPQVDAALDQSTLLFGIEFSAFVLVQVLVQAPIGAASDDYGRKPFVLLGLLVLIPATLAQGFVTAPWELLVARGFQGLASAAVLAPAGDFAKEGSAGTKLSVLTTAFSLGGAVGPLAAGSLIQLGYPIPFVFGGLLAAVGLVLVYTQVEEVTEAGAEGRVADGKATARD